MWGRSPFHRKPQVLNNPNNQYKQNHIVHLLLLGNMSLHPPELW
jgi:hypothetical protein